jgi:nitrogen fixation/metabolism regulation signal transduction histidine kinase
VRNPFNLGGFERRLAALFLLLSVPPTLLIAFFSAHYFMQSVQLVSNPGVEQSFSNSMEIARDFSAKLEEDASCAALRLADEYERANLPGAPGTGAPLGAVLEAVLEKVSRETHADFTVMYGLEGRLWHLRAVYPPGFARVDSELSDAELSDAELSGGQIGDGRTGTEPGADSAATTHAGAAAHPGTAEIAFRDPDVIASGLARGETLFAAGFALEQGFTEKMHGTADDLGRYRAVELYVSAKRRYIIIVTSILVVAAAVASALLSRLVARRISYPITELAQATELVAKGDLEHRVVVPARDEILSLVNGFNKMTQELQENKSNLIRAERIAAWRDVARRIAHEIKNPLTPMEIAIYRIKKRLETYADVAADERTAKDRAVIEESLDSILKEVGALKSIAQEFSSFAKLPDPRFESLNLNDTVKSVVELYSSSPNIQVKTNLAPGLPEVQADRDQMRSVVANLVKNAIEAMPAGGTLTVATRVTRPAQDRSFEAGATGAAGSRATRSGTAASAAGTAGGAGAAAGAIRIEISDTGPGIPEEIRERVFDPYFTTKSTGSGIGLALAYRIIADHRGRITFTTGDTGTTFVVDLPMT